MIKKIVFKNTFLLFVLLIVSCGNSQKPVVNENNNEIQIKIY
jgi:hypothetical protein